MWTADSNFLKFEIFKRKDEWILIFGSFNYDTLELKVMDLYLFEYQKRVN